MNPYKSLSVKNTLGFSFPKGALQRKTFSLSTGTHSGGRAFWTVSFEIQKACYVNLAPVTSADKRTSKTANTQLLRKHWENLQPLTLYTSMKVRGNQTFF